jgi:hypothetical protein
MEEQAPPPVAPPTPAPATRPTRTIVISAVAGVVLVVGIITAIVLPGRLRASASSASDPTKTGCPSAAAVPQWPNAANETVHEGDVNTTTNAAVNDTIEFDLPSGFRWNVESTSRALQALTPAGYYNPTGALCIWRFKATTSGQAVVKFSRQPLCGKGSICPPIIVSPVYVIDIH